MADTSPAQQSDGTQQLRDTSFANFLAELASTLPVMNGLHGWIDENTAAQLGLVLILNAVKFRSVDLLALVRGKVEKSRELEIAEVILDFPTAESEPPTPFAVVTEAADAVYTPFTGMHSVKILEDTLHAYGRNTVLRQHGRAELEYAIQVFFADKDDRAGCRKRLIEVLATEPDSDRTGRRIVLPFYFDRACRYQLVGASYPDDGEYAQAGRWPLVVRVKAEMQHVTLVEAPPAMRVPAPAVQLDSEA